MPPAVSPSLHVPQDELRCLLRRYQRLLKFDQVLCIAYCVAAGIPFWSLWNTKREWAFHITGALLILLIGITGLIVDRLVLGHAPRAKAMSYCVTTGFILSRLVLGMWAVAITQTQTRLIFGIPIGTGPYTLTLPELAAATAQMFLSPPIVGLALILGSYRVLYHIAVHFYLRLAPQHQHLRH